MFDEVLPRRLPSSSLSPGWPLQQGLRWYPVVRKDDRKGTDQDACFIVCLGFHRTFLAKNDILDVESKMR
jgi:hypothetical protein